jgi:hypothetical protein
MQIELTDEMLKRELMDEVQNKLNEYWRSTRGANVLHAVVRAAPNVVEVADSATGSAGTHRVFRVKIERVLR